MADWIAKRAIGGRLMGKSGNGNVKSALKKHSSFGKHHQDKEGNQNVSKNSEVSVKGDPLIPVNATPRSSGDTALAVNRVIEGTQTLVSKKGVSESDWPTPKEASSSNTKYRMDESGQGENTSEVNQQTNILEAMPKTQEGLENDIAGEKRLKMAMEEQGRSTEELFINLSSSDVSAVPETPPHLLKNKRVSWADEAEGKAI